MTVQYFLFKPRYYYSWNKKGQATVSTIGYMFQLYSLTM